MPQPKTATSSVEKGTSSGQPGLEWFQSLLAAIHTVQHQLESGSRHSESIARILQTALELTGAGCGMLASVVSGEPCRLNDVVASGISREEILHDFDELAREALDAGHYVAGKTAGGHDAVALLLSIGVDVYGVLVLCIPEKPWSMPLLDTLAPFAAAAAGVLRQFQDDMSGSQVGAFIDHLAEGILTFNDRGTVEAMNAAAEQVFGYNAEDIVGTRVSQLMAEPFATEHEDYLREHGEMRVIGYDELEGRRKNGTVFPMDLSVSQIEVQGRRVYIGITRDMTEYKARKQAADIQRANTQTLELLVRIDAVTGIANRRHFDEMIESEVRRAARERLPVGLVLCDIDFFKAFNDRYGHLAGDKALRSVAQAIDSCFQRAGELAARYGGEEFGVVIAGGDTAQAVGLAEKVRDRVGALSIPHGASPIADHITISIGVASVVPDPRFDPKQLIDAADRALYRAKGGGRDRIQSADEFAGCARKLRAL